MESRREPSVTSGAKWTLAVAAVMLTAGPVDAKIHLFGKHASKSVDAPRQMGGGQAIRYHWTLGNADRAHKDLVAEFKKVGLAPGQYVWTANAPTAGDTRVVVDLLTQMTYVYRGDRLIGASTMSSAKTGHITPYGNWTILEKRPFYRSKKYDNAPMPFMERIDDYGIAFHGGVNPGYPASHGCMRLPLKFAEKLYGVTKIGTKVVIEG
jgi:lipoprotein-anchoring transpeptidase ErfK/SrfK